MWLLSLKAHDELAWEEFHQTQVPPYAILSHTWGPDEVIFSDLLAGSFREKAGWRKIDFCGKQAARDGLRYFWVDTCCIDKWNMNELNEAINSMFRWYQRAAQCYVFLSDVPDPSQNGACQPTSWEAEFRKSKWFTRGWTLQELLAPATVHFFSKDGQILGDKRTLERLIHEITALPLTAIHGCSMDAFSFEARMEWAENRHTTEPEDGAYCLLGILNVELSLTYGEGKDKAMARLHEALEGNSLPYIIPYSRNDQFVGRNSQLHDMEAIMFGKKDTTKIAIIGGGGTGKSQLALEIAYRTKEARKDCCVFWIDASDTDSLLQAYRRVAQKLDIPGWDSDEQDIQALVHEHLVTKFGLQWLLIFDNADDFEQDATNGVSPWMVSLIKALPQSELGSIIFTTTNHAVAEMLTAQCFVDLDGTSSDTGEEMIQKHFIDLNTPDEQKQVGLLLAELSWLPLSIVHAAAYIKMTGSTIEFYLSLLRERNDAVNHTKQDPRIISITSSKDSVAKTVLISFLHLCEAHPKAAQYLCMVACMNRKDVPLEHLSFGLAHSIDEKNDPIRVLDEYKLITRRPAESALDIHRLVHEALRDWMREHQVLSSWNEGTIARLDRLFPSANDDHRYRHKWRRLLPHAQFALFDLTNASRASESTIVRPWFRKTKRLHSWARSQMRWLGKMKEENNVASRTTLLERDQSLPADLFCDKFNDAAMSLLSKCIIALDNDGRWEEAKELIIIELQLRTAKLGPEDPDTISSMTSLSVIYWRQGHWKEAEKLELRILEARRRILGKTHANTLTTMSSLATTYLQQEQWEKAKELELQVLELSDSLPESDRPDTLNSIANLGWIYLNQGYPEKAVELKKQVMEGRIKELGTDHPDTLLSMSNLATAYFNSGEVGKAEELQIKVLGTNRAKLGADHPSTLSLMNNIAFTWKAQKRYTDAMEIMEQCFRIRSQKLGPDNFDTINSKATLDMWRNESAATQGLV